MWICNYLVMLMLAYTICRLAVNIPRRPFKIILYIYMPFVGIYSGYIFSYFSTPFFLSGILLIMYLSGGRYRIWNMLLSMLSWMWFVLTDYTISVCYTFFGESILSVRSSDTIPWLMATVMLLLVALPATFLGKWLHKKLTANPELIPRPMLKLLFGETLVCVCIFLFNIIWGSLFDFPSKYLLFNGFLFAGFSAANLFLYLNLYRTMQENQKLVLELQAQDSLSDYTGQLEAHYQEMRRFRHDYMNLLCTLNGYIQQGDLQKLSQFFDAKIMTEGRLLLNKDAIIGRLSYIRVPEVKGIFYTKLIEAMNLQLQISLELKDEITHIDMDLLTLCRVLGIYLDNALEAAVLSDEKALVLAIADMNDHVLIHIENSTPPLPVSVEQLSAEGYSTKDNHSGLGLYNAQLLLSGTPNALSSTQYMENHFIQTLSIYARSQEQAV